MGLTTLTVVSLVITVGYVLASGLLMPRGLTAAKSPGTSKWQRFRARRLNLLLLPDVLLLAWVAAHAGLTGVVSRFAPLILAAVALALWMFAPRYLTSKVLPLALVAVGLDGIIWDGRFSTQGALAGHYGFSSPHETWPMATVIQAWAFIAVGLWLTWRRMDPDSRPYQLTCYEPTAGGSNTAVRGRAAVGEFSRGEPKDRGRRRWGLALLILAVLLVERLHPVFGNPLSSQSGWIAGMIATVGIAALLVFRFPAVTADLAITGLIALGLDGIKLASTWSWQMPPVAYGIVVIDGPRSATLAAAESLALVGAAIWLLPRALDDRTKSLFRSATDRELAGRVVRLTRTRADAVDSAAAELRRVERDLHDGAQARLIALGISLRAAERLIHSSPDAAAALVAEARESSLTALGELRDLVRGIRPPVLADRGLADAVRALALDTPLRTTVDVDLPGRPDLAVESACYFAVAELLANAVRHSWARQAQVQISHDDGLLRITVTDDGSGGADPAHGTGLAGLERRLAPFDGVLAVSSPPGGPTIVAIEVPCALSSLKTSTC